MAEVDWRGFRVPWVYTVDSDTIRARPALAGGSALGECPLKVVKALEGERALHPLSLPLTIMI